MGMYHHIIKIYSVCVCMYACSLFDIRHRAYRMTTIFGSYAVRVYVHTVEPV